MRTFLVAVMLMLCFTASQQAVASVYRGAVAIPRAEQAVSPSHFVRIQFARKGGGHRIRPGRLLRRFRRPAPAYRPPTSTRAYVTPRRVIRSNSGILRQSGRRPVRSSLAPPARDIGAGIAVQTARTRAAGEVLGVRRNGSVYDVKMLDRGRVRIVTIDAFSGSVLNVR